MSSFLAWGTAASEWGSMFIPRNGGIEGKLSASHIFLNTRRGGELSVVGGIWPDLQVLVTASMVFQLQRGERLIEVRQCFDSDPRIEYLEEGSQRLGIRVHLKLYDAENHYYGHGLVESWIYPNGEIFCAYAASFDSFAEAGVLLPGEAESGLLTSPSPPPEQAELQRATLEFQTPVDQPAARLRPQRALLYKQGDESIELYWQATGMRYDDVLPRRDSKPPVYERWPTYFSQAFAGLPPEDARQEDRRVVSLDWPTQGLPRDPTYVSLFRLGPRKLPAPEANLPLEVTGGEVYGNQGGYNDLEGIYTVRAYAAKLFIRLPEVAAPQRMSIKIIGLSWHGGIMCILDDEPFVPQLVTQGEPVDDPIAPLVTRPSGPADTAVVTMTLDRAPHGLEIRCLDGLQISYQSRHPDRLFGVFDSEMGAGQMRFLVSTANGRLQHFGQKSKTEWALTECFLYWARQGSASPDSQATIPHAFTILKNGPSDLSFQYASRNASDRIASTYEVRMALPAPWPVMSIRAKLEILKAWPYTSAMFCDAFPFPGVQPTAWWYRYALAVAPDGKHHLRDISQNENSGNDLQSFAGPGFFALAGSDRGNLVILVTDVPESHDYTTTLNLHHINWQLNLQFKDSTETPVMPKSGSTYNVSFELGLWGDAETSEVELLTFGRACLDAGRLISNDLVQV